MFNKKKFKELKEIAILQIDEIKDLKVLIESQRNEINSLRAEVEFLRKQNIELAEAYKEVREEINNLTKKIASFDK